MKRSVENWYYNLKLNENWRSYATLKLSYLKIMEVAISTRLETAVSLLAKFAEIFTEGPILPQMFKCRAVFCEF